MMGSLLHLIAGATLTHGTGLAAAVADTLESTVGIWLHVVAATLFLAAAGFVAVVWSFPREGTPRH